jgi:hypothetical protein
MFIAVVIGIVVTSALSARPTADVQQASMDPLVVSPDHYRLVFENEYVRVIRQQMAGRDRVPMHQHAMSAVMVLVTDQNQRQALPDGTTREQHRKAGEIFWSEPVTHAGENLSDKPYEYIRVDIKAATRR